MNKALPQALLDEIYIICDTISAPSTKLGNMSVNGLSEVPDILSGSIFDPILSISYSFTQCLNEENPVTVSTIILPSPTGEGMRDGLCTWIDFENNLLVQHATINENVNSLLESQALTEIVEKRRY